MQQQLASPFRMSLHYNCCTLQPAVQAGLQPPSLLLKCPAQRSAEILKTQRFRRSVRRAIVSSGVVRCLLQPLPPAVLICHLFQCSLVAHCRTGRRGPFCWLLKMDSRNCDGHGCPSQQRLDCRQCTDGEAKQQRLYDAGGVQAPAAEGNSTRKRLKSQDKAAEVSLSQSQRTRRAFFHSRIRWEMLVREWGKLGSAIRRAAAVCLAPSAGADEEDELDLPYVQLDKVTRAVSREAFGPLYLVT